MHDILIKNGTLVDGTGAPRTKGDIAIDGDTIVAVGEVTGEARRVIDAEGHLVTPGWVDIHTHYDGQATWDPVMAPSSWHGVTTVVMGNCGVGFAPVRPGEEGFLIELMEGVEDIPGSALAEGIDWRWESFPEYLDALETMQRTIDVGTQVPHGAIRAYVMGTRCNDTSEIPTADEIESMQQLVREGIEAGALGFSSSRTLLHTDKQGVHVPGTFAGSDEMLALGLAMRGLDHGVFEMVSDHLGTDDEWAWVKAFAAETGRPITLVPTSPGAYEGGKIYRIAEEAREKGMEIRPQMAARPTGVLHGLSSSFHIFARCPSYLEIADLDLSSRVAALRDPGRRAKLLEEARTQSLGFFGNAEALLWMIFPLGDMPNYEPERSESVAGRAEAQGVDSVEMMLDLLLEQDGRELFYQPLGNYSTYNLDPMREALQHPNVLFGLSDGGAHCGIIADAGMPTFVLTHWARDRSRGEQLPLEFLVRCLSRNTAHAYGMTDRGELAVGKKADINVIDFDKLRLFRPEATYDLPLGGRRLVQRVEGYRYTLKSGEVTFEDGEHTGALPGTLVRGGASPV